MRRFGYGTFAEVAAAVQALPYGRVKDPDDAASIFKEGRGTCSSKHRFLAALAHECGHMEVQLIIGLYEMSEDNTPGVGDILAGEYLKSLPEAHCYLMRNGERFDFTGLAASVSSPFDALIEERIVSPGELSVLKPVYHRQAIRAWARQAHIDPDRAWNIRERCIAALAGDRG